MSVMSCHLLSRKLAPDEITPAGNSRQASGFLEQCQAPVDGRLAGVKELHQFSNRRHPVMVGAPPDKLLQDRFRNGFVTGLVFFGRAHLLS